MRQGGVGCRVAADQGVKKFARGVLNGPRGSLGGAVESKV